MSQGTDRVREAQDRLDPAGWGSVPPPSAQSSVTSSPPPRLDPGQVAELYQQHANDLQAFLLGLLRDRELASEALQITFTKALEIEVDTIHDLKGWLFRVAFREAMNVRRRQQIDQRCLKKVAWNLETAAGTEFQAGWKGEANWDATTDGASNLGREDRPDERLVKREEIERVRGVLKTLPPEQQRIVQMRIYEEKTFQSIADELDLPLGTVLSRMRLALQKLELKLK